MRHFNFFFVLLLIFGCQKESTPEQLILSKVIIGKWQMIQIMGFPYSATEWETLPYIGPIYEFADDGTYIEIVNSLDPQHGTYSVNDTTNTVKLLVKGLLEVESSVEITNSNEIIFGGSGFEGPVKYKYKRLE